MAQPRRAPGPHTPEDLSVLDWRIIDHLRQDGRRPFTQIATDLGVSEAAVRSRTNRLIERRVLQIAAVVDPAKIGFHREATIAVHCDPAAIVPAAEAIAEFPEVTSVAVVAGACDLLVEVICADNDALLDFLDRKLGGVGGIKSTETFPYLRVVKRGRGTALR